MVFPPLETPDLETPAEAKIIAEPASESGKDMFSEEKLDFSEFDKMEKGEEDSSLSDKEFDLSEFDKIFEEKFPAAGDVAEGKEGEAELSDAEDMDFSDLEKMLEIDVKTKISEKKPDESVTADTEDLDLSELENMIKKLDETGVEAADGEPEELKFDIEPVEDEIVSSIDDEGEVDFSDLEKMLESGEDEKAFGKQDKSESEFDLELQTSGRKEKIDDAGDLDLSELERIISSADESESDGDLKKEPEEVLDLDFSDFESVLAEETTGVEKTGEKEQELELKFDSAPEEDETSKEKEDALDLDFSDVEKMLEAEEKADLTVGKIKEESLDLELVAEEPSEKPKEAAAWADTIVTDKEGLGLADKETEEEHPHLEEYAIDKFRNTIEEPEAAVAVAESIEKEAEPEKEGKPVKSGKPSGVFLAIIAVIVIIAGAGAFAVFKPFGIEIPFLGEILGSKSDEKGTQHIIPLDDSIKGDFVRTKSGNIFVITGTVKNEYKHPRSYISVTGKLFKKGKMPLKSETVYCGNLIPAKDIEASDPALMKKRLQNRFGDKKSNVKVQSGGTLPFMIIFENIADELDEYSVEAAGSAKE